MSVKIEFDPEGFEEILSSPGMREEMEKIKKMRKKRTENSFRSSMSANGEFSPKIDKATTGRLSDYCRQKNLNRTRFVIDCINERLDALEGELYLSMSKEELVSIIINNQARLRDIRRRER